MIVLDTNVVSELIREGTAPGVLHWLARQRLREVALTATTVAQLLYGGARLPSGRRRRELEARLGATVDEDFVDRVWPFDVAAARRYGLLVADRERAGRPIGVADAQIAAISLQRGAALATRNTRDFEGLGLTLIDPWTA